MKRKTRYQRLREARARQRAADVPDVIRAKADAEQQMQFFDQLGPQSREAVSESRFDADAVATWREGYVGELCDPDLADRIRLADGKYSGRFGPAAPGGF